MANTNQDNNMDVNNADIVDNPGVETGGSARSTIGRNRLMFHVRPSRPVNLPGFRGFPAPDPEPNANLAMRRITRSLGARLRNGSASEFLHEDQFDDAYRFIANTLRALRRSRRVSSARGSASSVGTNTSNNGRSTPASPPSATPPSATPPPTPHPTPANSPRTVHGVVRGVISLSPTRRDNGTRLRCTNVRISSISTLSDGTNANDTSSAVPNANDGLNVTNSLFPIIPFPIMPFPIMPFPNNPIVTRRNDTNGSIRLRWLMPTAYNTTANSYGTNFPTWTDPNSNSNGNTQSTYSVTPISISNATTHSTGTGAPNTNSNTVTPSTNTSGNINRDLVNETIVASASRDSAANETIAASASRDSAANETIAASASRDSAANGTIAASASRDSAANGTIAASASRNSAANETIAASASRGSAANETIAASASRDSAANETIADSASRDSAAYETIAASASHDSAANVTIPASASRDSAANGTIAASASRDSAANETIAASASRDSAANETIAASASRAPDNSLDLPSTSRSVHGFGPRAPSMGTNSSSGALTPGTGDDLTASSTSAPRYDAMAYKTSLRRLQKELRDMAIEPLTNITAGPTEDNIYDWKATIVGPAGSVYDGGIFNLSIRIPPDYPFSPPTVKFLNRIYHCNISSQGFICLDILKSNNWSPALTVAKLLLSISSLLTDCNPEDPLVASIAREYLANREKHDKTAREWTRRYAQ